MFVVITSYSIHYTKLYEALDQADVSASARMYQMRDKAVEGLKKIPDPREEKVNEISYNFV